MDQTINEMENKEYLNKIQNTYDAFGKDITPVSPTAVVPASVELSKKGDLYVEDGVLKFRTNELSKAIKRYCENNMLVNKTNEKSNVIESLMSMTDSFVQGA